jgi:hypothetical protein
LPLGLRYIQLLYSEVYEAEPGFGIEKLGAVCVYPYPNMLAVVCCGILKVRAESSMVV